MTKEQVIRLTTTLLNQMGHGFVFEVIQAGVRQDNSWWYVPVLATRNGKDAPREVTVNLYANIEDELDQQHNLNVLIVPVVSEPRKPRPVPRSRTRKSRT